jgi:hypothetical protein
MAEQGKAKEIRVLSIRQPHADHVIFGTKWCENRTWRTHYHGELFIHASRWDGPSDQQTPGNGEVSSIIGSVRLVDVVGDRDQGVTDAEVHKVAKSHGLSTKRECMAHVSGPVCWILTEAKPLKDPVPCKGQLGVFTRAVPSNLLKFGRTSKKVWTGRRQRQEQGIRVGSRVNYKRRNYYARLVDENIVGVAETKQGSPSKWFDISELELGWHTC